MVGLLIYRILFAYSVEIEKRRDALGGQKRDPEALHFTPLFSHTALNKLTKTPWSVNGNERANLRPGPAVLRASMR